MDKIKGKKVLVTGGAGFIGSHIVQRLVSLGAQVVVLDNLVTGKRENIEAYLDKINFIERDLTDEAALDLALEGVDLISHQAALRSVPKSVERPFDYHQVNVTGTLRLLIQARDKGVKKVVFASSSSVYGERFDFPEKEDDLPQPVSPYASTKLMGEYYNYLFSKLYGLEAVSLRYFNVFGPRQSLENRYAVVVPKFITSLLANQGPPIFGDGNQERDFTYIEDVVDANILALAGNGLAGQVFNIAGGSPKSINYLLQITKELTAKSCNPKFLDLRPGDVRKTFADISKAKKLLGWQPQVPFYEGIKKTVEYFNEKTGISG